MVSASKKINHLVTLLLAMASVSIAHGAVRDGDIKVLLGKCTFSWQSDLERPWRNKPMLSAEFRLLDAVQTTQFAPSCHSKQHFALGIAELDYGLQNLSSPMFSKRNFLKSIHRNFSLGTYSTRWNVDDEGKQGIYFYEYGTSVPFEDPNTKKTKISLNLEGNCVQFNMSGPTFIPPFSFFGRFGYCFSKRSVSSFHLTTVETLLPSYSATLHQALRKGPF